MNVKAVVDTIIRESKVGPLEETCDLLIAGDWNSEVTGIVTTFMATVEVIQDAILKGANLIITHEPTYFTGHDQKEWLKNDPVYVLKQRLIEENHINIWRFHDHMHMTNPDLVFVGLHKELGWESFLQPDRSYVLPATTIDQLAEFLKEKLKVKTAQIIGNSTMQVERVGMLIGGGSLGFGSEQMPMEFMRDRNLDVVVCGDILEWTLCAYVRDASQLGLNKALIILGHNRTEEVGMKHLPEWLAQFLPDIPVQFSEAGEPFSYI